MSDPSVPQLRVGGTLGPSDLYVERAEDTSVYELLAAGEFCNILTSRQMGKSSLMVRLMNRLAKERRARIASVDMAGDLGTPDDADRWYIGFLDSVALQLELDHEVEDWWRTQGRGTPNARLLQFFREIAAGDDDRPVYIFVDEVDASLKLSYSDDFFTAVRSIYNQRSTVPEFRRLTFCLIGVASPSELIKERRTTPYNIGRTIELRDFDPERDDLRPLYAAMSSETVRGEELVRAVLAWTAGHPFLTTALCQHARARGARTPAMIQDVIDDAITAGRHREIASHMASIDRFLSTRLHDEGKTLKLYRKILRGQRVPDQIVATHLELRLSGLVKRNADDLLIPRNRLYVERFGLRWLSRTRPMRTQQRLVRAVLATGAVAVATTGAAIYWALARPVHAPIRAEVLDAVMHASDADEAATRLAAICTAVRAGAGITAEQRAAVHRHVRELWDAQAAPLEAAATRARDTQNIDEALILEAKAAMRRDQPRSWMREPDPRYPLRSLVTTLRGHTGNVYAVRWLTAHRVVSVGSDDRIRIFDVDRSIQVGGQRGSEALSPALETCPDGSCVLTATRPATGYLWDGELNRVATFAIGEDPDHPVDVWALAVPPGQPGGSHVPVRIAASDDQGDLWLGRLIDDKDHARRFVVDHAYPHVSDRTRWPVYTTRFSARGDQLVTAALDGVRIIDLASGSVDKLDIRADEPHDARLSSPEPSLVAVAARHEAVIYDLAKRERLRSFADAKTFHTIAFVPGNQQAVIAATTRDDHGLVVVWQIQDGATRAFQTPALVRDAEISPDPGLRLATAHADGSIRIWQIEPEPEDYLKRNLEEIWQSLQRKLGLTVDDHGQVVPLGSADPRPGIRYPTTCEQSVSAR